jgi:hypothetical protein
VTQVMRLTPLFNAMQIWKNIPKLLPVMLAMWLCAGCSHQTRWPTVLNNRIDPSDDHTMVVANEARLAGVDRVTLRQQAGDSTLAVPGAVTHNVFHAIFVAPFSKMWDYFAEDTPTVAARKILAPNPDARRYGILRIAKWPFGRKMPYTQLFYDKAAGDPDFTVRAAAIRALNWARDPRGIDLAIRDLDDDQALVRLEAAKYLANIPSNDATPALIEHMQHDSDVDVRIACADALRNFAASDVARNLVQTLDDRDFSVSWQAHQSLMLLTGRDYGYDTRAWLDYLDAARPFG